MSELCESCGRNEGVVHLEGGRMIYPPQGGVPRAEAFALLCCEDCARIYDRARSYEGLFPGSHEEQLVEEVRVIAISSEHTVLRLIRTEHESAPQDWVVLSARLPECVVGGELTMQFTPSELEWLKGERELPR